MSGMQSKAVYVRCDCGCCVMEVTRDDFYDTTYYNVAILDSRYDHDVNSVWGRIKRAVKVLLGKPVYFNDCCMSQEKFDKWLNKINELRG